MNKYILFLALISLAAAVKPSIKKKIGEEESKIRVFGLDGKENETFSILFEYALECIRNLFIHGDETTNFPSLQELEITPYQVFNISDEDHFRFYSEITNLILYNLGDFSVRKADFHLIGFYIDYDINFHLTTSGHYAKGDVNIFNIVSVQGEGEMNFEMDFNPTGQAKISIKSLTPLLLEVLEYHGFFMINPDFHITGIMNDEVFSSAISKQVSNMIEQYVGENIEEVSNLLSPPIMELINRILANSESEFWDLINLAIERCPEAKSFIKILHDEAVKQEFTKNDV